MKKKTLIAYIFAYIWNTMWDKKSRTLRDVQYCVI